MYQTKTNTIHFQSKIKCTLRPWSLLNTRILYTMSRSIGTERSLPRVAQTRLSAFGRWINHPMSGTAPLLGSVTQVLSGRSIGRTRNSVRWEKTSWSSWWKNIIPKRNFVLGDTSRSSKPIAEIYVKVKGLNTKTQLSNQCQWCEIKRTLKQCCSWNLIHTCT